MSAVEAGAELSTLATTFVHGLDPAAPPRTAVVVPIDQDGATERRQMTAVAWLLGGVVGAVLLIACANVANLLLSRAAARRRELAVRLAIGANRWRLVRQLLTESLLLSTLGGAAGVTLAWLVVRAFRAAPPPPGALPVPLAFSVDGRVLGFSLVLALVTGLVFGLAPALQASRPALVPALKDESFAPDSRARRWNLRRLLVVAQVALSLLLMVSAGLFVRSLRAAYEIDPGLDASHLLSAPLNINLLRYTRAQGREFYAAAVDRVASLTGVQSASVARVAVIAGGGRTLSVVVEGQDGPEGRMMSEGGARRTPGRNTILANVVGNGFFDTLGITRSAGRGFAPTDGEGAPPVTILSEAAVRRHFAGVDPIGRRISFSGPRGPWVEVIGVVRDSTYAALGEDPAPVAYLPLAQNHETGMTLYVRTSVPPATLVSSVRRELQALEPNLPVPDIATMPQTIGVSLYAPRMGALLLSVFGGLALALATVGVYGVLAFSIARRTHEMGIRIALGATSVDVFGLVVREGMGLVAAGTALGLVASLLLSGLLASFLYGVSTHDTATFAGVTVALLAVALAACLVPARRAMRVDPITALRTN